MHRKSIVAKALALAVIISVLGCEKKVAETGPPAPPEVLVTQVISGDVPVIRSWVGTLDGSENAEIRGGVTGYFQKSDYKQGSFVKQGDMLFEIDPRPFEAALAQAKSELDQVQATQAATQADFERSQDLYNKKVISVQEYENKRQLNQAQVAKSEALQAAAQTAQLNLDYTKISAPVDGIAGLSKANIGDLVGTGSEVTLTTVSKIDPIRLYFPINEQDYKKHASALQKGMQKPEAEREASVELVFADGTVYPQKGKFSFVDRQVDPTTGTILVAANFPNPDHSLRPGQFAKASAAIEKISDALLVPERALSELQGSYQVGVIDDNGKAEIRPIKIGPRYNHQVVVTEGLKKGETVIVEGLQNVRPGLNVNVKPYEKSAAQESDSNAPGPQNAKEERTASEG